MSDTYAYELLERIAELESENERLRQLPAESDSCVIGCMRKALELERDRLRKAIEAAPCGVSDLQGPGSCYQDPCICWKREALGDQPKEE